jgi:hypothetical protein
MPTCATAPDSFFLVTLEQNGIVLLHDTCRQDESDVAEEGSRYFSVHYLGRNASRVWCSYKALR